MAASGFTLEAVRDFIIQNNFKVSNHELVTKFKSHLNDPNNKVQNREKFKDYVNTLATIKVDEKGDKVLVLKKKYRPDDDVFESRQDRAVSEPPMNKEDSTDGGGMSKVRSENNITGDKNSDSSSMIGSVSNLSMSSSATKEGSDQYEDECNSSGSGYVSLEPEEREWIVVCSSGEYHPIFKMLTANPKLATVRDFLSGYTALHWAAKHGKAEVVKLVASKHGVDVNKRSNGGYTPLHLAAIHGHEDIIELLVQTYKADPNLRDYSGKKAKQYLRNTASTKAQRIFGHDIDRIALGELLLSRKLGSSVVSGRSLDDSFTRSASFRRSKQVKAISSLIHGTSSGVKAMFRSTWAGSAEELNRVNGHMTSPRNTPSRSPSITPPGSNGPSPRVRRRGTVSGNPDRDRELMPPPSAPVRRSKASGHSSSQEYLNNDEMTRTISEPSLGERNASNKTYI